MEKIPLIHDGIELVLSLTRTSAKLAKVSSGIEEGYLTMEVRAGNRPFFTGEVRTFHNKRYSVEKKKEMLLLLDEIRLYCLDLIETQEEEVRSYQTTEEE
jgi:ribosomal protein L31